jgi:hypothetical protein
MKVYPIQMGVTPKGDIILAQTDDENGQEQVITISPDQVEQLTSALRAAVEALRKLKGIRNVPPTNA